MIEGLFRDGFVGGEVVSMSLVCKVSAGCRDFSMVDHHLKASSLWEQEWKADFTFYDERWYK